MESRDLKKTSQDICRPRQNHKNATPESAP